MPRRTVMSVLDKQLVFVTGKGGVGKTVVAAAIAQRISARGRRTLICEIDTDPAMGRLFGAPRIGFAPAQVGSNLFACNLTARECTSAFVRRFVPSSRVADLILSNSVARTFFEAAPSVTEAVILDQLATLVTESAPRFDAIVVDLPASGHAVTFLQVPKSMARMVAVGDLADHLRKIATLISDPSRTEVVVVAIPDELAVNETIELWHRLRDRVDTPAGTVILNGIRRNELRSADLDLCQALDAREPTLETARLARAVQLGLYWQHEDNANAERLANAVTARVIPVPFLFQKVDEPELVAACGRALASGLEAEA